jgi:PAS domain S-box-containing protein
LYEKAKRQEDIYLSLINSTPDAIVLYDLDGRVTYLNQAHTETFGWTLDEVFGRPLPCVPEWDREETDRLIRSIVDEGVPCRLYETKRATKRGALLDVSLSASRYHDHEGRPAGVLVVLRNISESKLARAALLKMSKVFMESIDPIMIRNLEGEVVDINAAAEGMYGWTREELMGKSFKTIVPEFRHARADELQERCLRGEEVRNIEALRCTKSGEVIPVLLSLSLLTDDYGQPLGIAAITKDLTDLKRTEDMLRRRTEALENSNRDLEQFAYIAAHDLREPLIGVAAYLKILQRRHSQKLDHEAQKFVDLALESTTRMDALIQSLLAYSRLGSESPSFERVNANDVVSQAISNLESLIHESRAQLTVDPLPSVVANESQLVQLFQNLISNAVKFAADEPLRIRIGVQPSEDGHCFFVQDNGIGIEAPDFDRVFMIFQRVGGDRERPGTGIGLANCKKIVERHGGRIWVESTPGVGSTFFFTVPFEPGA